MPLRCVRRRCVAARLLASEQTEKHNKANYVLTGPENVTGEQILTLIEEYLGEPARDVKYNDFSFLDVWAESMSEQRTLTHAIGRARGAIWDGSTLETRSKEVP
jgi:hypothetical protein